MINNLKLAATPQTPLSFPSTSYADPLIDKIRRVALSTLECLKGILAFPFRYVGSKTWSILGIILHTPYVLFRKIILKDKTPITTQLFGRGYHFEPSRKLSKEELETTYLDFFCHAAFSHKESPKCLHPNWLGLDPTTFIENPEEIDSELEASGFSIYNKKTGLKITFLQKDDEIHLVFGALNALNEILAGSPGQQQVVNKNEREAKINYLGLSPQIYSETSQIAEKILKLPFFKEKKVTLVGQCFGGALASYAALELGRKAICINALQLGAGLQKNLGQDKLQKAEELITHIRVQRDYMSLSLFTFIDLFLSAIGIRTPGNFGKKYEISTAFKSPTKSHVFALSSAMNYLGYDTRTMPSDVFKKTQ